MMWIRGKLLRIRERLSSGEGKLLVIQTAFLGDVILLTPLLQALRKAFPKVELSVVTIPECAEVLKGQADEIITFDKRNRKALRERWLALIDILRDRNFDIALIPHRSFRSGLTAYRAGIPVRIGFNRGNATWFLTHKVKYCFETYEGARNLELLKPLTDNTYNMLPVLLPNDAVQEKVSNILLELQLETDKFAVIAPGSVWRSKRWFEEYFRQLTKHLEVGHNLPVVTIGSKEDRETCSRIVSSPKKNFAGSSTPLQSAALMARARFLVSGDTAPAHIATAMETRQIIIFGSTTPSFGFVPDIPAVRIVQSSLWCRPCSDHGRNFCPRWGSLKCLKSVTPEMVIDVIDDWL